MKVEFYKSAICPRCYMAGKILNNAVNSYPEVEIEKIDIASSIKRTKESGIKMIPAIKIDNEVLSGLVLTKNRIFEFIENKLGNKRS